MHSRVPPKKPLRSVIQQRESDRQRTLSVPRRATCVLISAPLPKDTHAHTHKRRSLLHPVPFNDWPQSRQAQSQCRSVGVSKSGEGKGGAGRRRRMRRSVEEGRGGCDWRIRPTFSSSLPPTLARRRTARQIFVFFFLSGLRIHTHTHTLASAYISFLSISPYFFSSSPLLSLSRPQTRNTARISQLQSSAAAHQSGQKRGPVEQLLLQLTIHVTE